MSRNTPTRTGSLLATQRCPHCGSRRRRDWPDCWHCNPKELADSEQVLEAIADSQKFLDDVGLDEILEPPGGHVDYDDISGREWNGGWTHKYHES